MYKMFTHNDLDGIGCAVLAKLAHNTYNEIKGVNIDIEYLGYNNCDDRISNFFLDNEHENYEFVYITDLSLKESTIDIINRKCDYSKVIILDHHKTSEHYNTYLFAYKIERIDDVLQCGTTLFYKLKRGDIYRNYVKHFENALRSEPRPLGKIKNYIDTAIGKNLLEFVVQFDPISYFVESVRLYDTWQWQDDVFHIPYELNMLLDVYSPSALTDLIVDMLINNPFQLIYSDKFNSLLGSLSAMRDSYIKKAIENAIITNIDGHTVAVTFAEKHQSMIGNVLAQNSDIDYSAIIDLNGKKISFRSVGDFDVSEIAKKYGGGGHKNASGAVIDSSLLVSVIVDVLNNKH